MRVLFVDDDADFLRSLRTLMRRLRKEFDAQFAADGQTAVSMLDAQRFDVAVVDLQMPGMSGAELLTIIQKRWPGITRVVLSGSTTRDAAVRLSPHAHQFLAKPCASEDLRAAVLRACDLHRLLDSERLRSKLGGLVGLPSSSAVCAELAMTLGSENSGTSDVAGVVAQDPALMTRVLQLANSSFFALPRPVRTIGKAVQMLGLAPLRALVAGLATFSAFEKGCRRSGFSVSEEQRRAVVVSNLCGRISAAGVEREEAMLAGMLHAIGKLAIACALPDERRAIAKRVKESKELEWKVERDMLGFSHAQIGGYLLSLWGLPMWITEIIVGQHEPAGSGRTGFDALGVVHVACALLHEVQTGEDAVESGRLDLGYLVSLGVADRLAEWKAVAQTIVAESTEP